MKKTLVAGITTALVMGAMSTTFAATNPFSDVPADHWAYDAVAQLAQDGVIEGYGDGTFAGDKAISRYEMAQMVAKAMAKKEVPAADKAELDKLAAEFPYGVVLIVCAGMNYAAYVEAIHHKDVLSSAQMRAEQLIQELLDDYKNA